MPDPTDLTEPTEPSAEAIREYGRKLSAVRAARAAGDDSAALEADLARFMAETGMAEEAPFDAAEIDADLAAAAPADGPVGPHEAPGLLAVALLEARAAGDAETAADLEALLAHPELAAELVAALAREPAGAPTP